MPTIQTVDKFSGTPTAQTETRQMSVETNQTPMPPTEGALNLGTPDTIEEKSEPVSPQYAALARKERIIRSQERQVKEEKLAIQQEREAMKAEREFLQLLDQDPLTALAKRGLHYDKIVELAINQPNPEFKSLQDEIKSLKDNQTSEKEQRVKDQQAQWDKAVDAIRNDVTDLVGSDANYEMVKETGSVEDVVELITRSYRENGETMTIEEAAQQVEEYLLEEAEKIARIKKVQSKLTPTQEAVAPTKTPGATTLTSAMSANRPLTAKERAILAFNNQLPKG